MHIIKSNKRIIEFFQTNYITLFVFVFIYRQLLDYLFANVMVSYYSYYTFSDMGTNQYVFLSWIVLALFTLIIGKLYKNTSSVTNLVLFYLFLISFVPFTTMIRYGNFSYSFVFANSLYFFVLYVFNAFYEKKINLNIVSRIPRMKGRDLITIIAIVSFLVVIYISGKYAGFRLEIGLSSSLDWRHEYADYSVPTVLRYVFSWTKCINTILLVYFLVKKKFALAIICIYIQMLAYGVNGMKLTLFIGFLALCIALLPRLNINNMGDISLVLITIFLLVAILEYVLNGTYYIAGLVVMRIFFIPNMISYNYYSFFTTHTPDFFRGSFLRFFGFETPYPNLQYLMTEYAMGSTEAGGSNNGLISDAITNLGLIGIVVFPILLVITFRVLERTMEGLDARIKVSWAVLQTMLVISTFLLPMLLTDGLLIMFILFDAMKRNELCKKGG